MTRHKPVGHYGNGFKSGSMRLGKDALVLSRHGQGKGWWRNVTDVNLKIEITVAHDGRFKIMYWIALIFEQPFESNIFIEVVWNSDLKNYTLSYFQWCKNQLQDWYDQNAWIFWENNKHSRKIETWPISFFFFCEKIKFWLEFGQK